MKNLIIVLIITFSFYTVKAQECMQIGTNFGGIDAQVFKDLKKSSTHFFTQNIVYLANDSNYWDTGLIDSIPTDLNGYPTVDVPFNHTTVDTSQMYHFIVAGNTVYPTGHYVLHFDGVGVLEISNWSDAQNITFPNSNTIEFDINTATNSGIHISVISSQATDYVRNITIVHQDDLSTFHTQPFREELISLSKDFENLRFMDWMGTNQVNWAWYDTTILTWNNRIPKEKHRVHDEHGGMSYEHIIEFTNAVNKDAWINIPHLADSNYIYQMATMFKDDLNADLMIYVEFSNEVWNNIFDQTIYVQENGPYTNDLPRNYAWFATKSFKIFEDVFGIERNRLKFVIAGLDWSLIDAVPTAISLGADIDFVSYPGYFNLGNTGWADMDALGVATTAADIITTAKNNMNEDFYWMKSFKELVCDPYDIDFVMYEGGQHLLRMFGVEEVFQNAIYQAQLDTGMYDLYQDLLNFCKDSLEVKLFNHYLLYGPNESSYGSWGMVESIYETPNTPKYNALMSFKCEGDSIIEPIDTLGVINFEKIEVTIFPNPVNEFLKIKFKNVFEGELIIYDVNGKKILTEKLNTIFKELNVNNLVSGVYFIKGKSIKEQFTFKFFKK